MKKEVRKLAGKTKKEPPVLSTEGQEMKQLEDIRKELRKKENRSQRERERDKVKYTDLNKTVNRQRSQEKRTDHVEKLYFKVVEDQPDIQKTKWKGM